MQSRWLHYSSYAVDQSKLSIEAANWLHRRDCSASTQYAMLHPSRLIERFLSAVDALPYLPVGEADRIRINRNPISHKCPPCKKVAVSSMLNSNLLAVLAMMVMEEEGEEGGGG